MKNLHDIGKKEKEAYWWEVNTEWWKKPFKKKVDLSQYLYTTAAVTHANDITNTEVDYHRIHGYCPVCGIRADAVTLNQRLRLIVKHAEGREHTITYIEDSI